MVSNQISLRFDNSRPYRAGDSISGKVVVSCAKENVVESIFVTFVGQEKVDFHSGRGHPFREDLLSKSIILAGHENIPVTLTEGNVAEYQFSFPLPDKLPSSLNAGYGKIHYYAFAGINELGHNHPPFMTSRKPFIVQSIVDLNAAKVDIPVTFKMETSLDRIFRIKGYVSANIYMPKTGFALEENITMIVAIHNRSKKVVAPTVTLTQKICFRATRDDLLRDNPKWTCSQIECIAGPLVPGSNGTSSWAVPDLWVSNDFPPSSTKKDEIISVNYELMVKINTESSTIAQRCIPVLIGTIPTLPNATAQKERQQKELSNSSLHTNYGSFAYTSAARSDLPPPNYDDVVKLKRH